MPGELNDMLTAPVVLIALGHSLKIHKVVYPKQEEEQECFFSIKKIKRRNV